jgi:NAD-dependent DNA ligase
MAGARRRVSPDHFVMQLCLQAPNLLIPHFLMHSWLYYVKDTPLVSDDTFDWITKELGARWDSLEHRHKALIDPSLLKTGFYLEYPRRVPHAALAMVSLLSPPSPPRRRKKTAG